MTRNQFAIICSGRSIDPGVALESDIVRNAIRQGPDAVREALDSEF